MFMHFCVIKSDFSGKNEAEFYAILIHAILLIIVRVCMFRATLLSQLIG